MKSVFWLLAGASIISIMPSFLHCKNINIRSPSVAGIFYPSSPSDLKRDVHNFLKKVPGEAEGEVFALIVPHAGYIYSGEVASYAYKLLQGKKIDTVILMGSAHRVGFEGISVANYHYFETPLGKVEIDRKLARQLISKSKYIFWDEKAHQKEHSLEVQIPFLQVVLSNFKIVPLLFGYPDERMHHMLKEALLDVLSKSKKKILLIASSDMSHYHPYATAYKIDKTTLNLISNMDADNLEKKLKNKDVELCGSSAVLTVLQIAKKLKNEHIKILKYANSGDTAGDKSQVVGYTSAVIYSNKKRRSYMEKEFSLSREEKKKLLNIARTTLENHLQNKKIPEFKIEEKKLTFPTGCFVTLKKNKNLRGCIGNMTSSQPLYKLVSDMVISSATLDSRFSPVKFSELKDIEIEISVLSPMEKIDDVNKIEVGKHGILIKKGRHQGVFLPQVATEQGWTRDEFLENLCTHKMGLSPRCYQEKDVEIYIYSAVVFSEKEIK